MRKPSNANIGISWRSPRSKLRSIPTGPHRGRRSRNSATWIDSAANNHIRFVRAVLEPEFRGPGYAQNAWVDIHGYQDMPWQSILILWLQLNDLLASLIAPIPKNRMETQCFIGSAAPVTLAFLIEDYILHMQHHVDHMLKRERVTAYPSAAAQPK